MRAALLEEHRKPLAIATDVDVASPGPDEVVGEWRGARVENLLQTPAVEAGVVQWQNAGFPSLR